MPWRPFAGRLSTMEQRNFIEIRTGAIFAGALALVMLPLSLFMSFLMAGFFHEFCHYLALRLADVKIYKISIGPFGASMETEPMEPGREVLCAIAGPVGSFLLILFYPLVPRIAVCALVQGSFNFLPIYPLDGGRAVKGTLEILKIPGRKYIYSAIQLLTVILICMICLYGFFKWNLGCGVLFLGALLALRTFPRKTPCKEARFRVQ